MAYALKVAVSNFVCDNSCRIKDPYSDVRDKQQFVALLCEIDERILLCVSPKPGDVPPVGAKKQPAAIAASCIFMVKQNLLHPNFLHGWQA